MIVLQLNMQMFPYDDQHCELKFGNLMLNFKSWDCLQSFIMQRYLEL